MLQFQNQKLIQKLETQKVEINALEEKFSRLKDKQHSYDKTLAVVNKSWEEVQNFDAIILSSSYSLFFP